MNDWIEERAEKLVGSAPQAAAEYEWARYIRGTLMAKCERSADQEVWRQCLSRLDEIDAVNNAGKVESFVGRFGWAIASLLFVVILAAGVFNRGGSELPNHQFGSIFGEDPDVLGPQNADRLMTEEMGTSLPAVESAVTVVGASLREVDGKSYAIIHMVDGNARLLLYVIRDVSSLEGFDKLPGRGDYSGGRLNGHNCVTWIEDDLLFMVMGDRPVARLVGIADRMRQ